MAEVISDRGFSYADHTTWADQLRDRRIEQVLDLHQNDHGVTDYKGLKMVAGTPHCPAMPAHLEDISRPVSLSAGTRPKNPTRARRAEHDRRVAEIDAFDAQIAERDRYAFTRVSRGRPQTPTGKGGVERYQCPAQAGKLKCLRCPLSMALPGEVPALQNPPAEADAPHSCGQRTVSIPPTVSPKLRQRYRWGSPEWRAAYSRRARVEGTFGLLKSPHHGGVRREWTRQVGIIKTTLALAVAVMSTNLHQLLLWADATGNRDDPLTRITIEPTEFDEVGANAHSRDGPAKA